MSEVELKLTADLDQATKELRGFSKEYAGLVSQIEKPLRQVNFARDLERDLEASGKAVGSKLVAQRSCILAKKNGADAMPAAANQHHAQHRLANDETDRSFHLAARCAEVVLEREIGTGVHDAFSLLRESAASVGIRSLPETPVLAAEFFPPISGVLR